MRTFPALVERAERQVEPCRRETHAYEDGFQDRRESCDGKVSKTEGVPERFVQIPDLTARFSNKTTV